MAQHGEDDVDRQLLYGILALQNNFIGQPVLVTALRAWVSDRSRPIGLILRNFGAIDDRAHSLLEALVDHHLKNSDHDSRKSLAALGGAGASLVALEVIADPAIRRSLEIVASGPSTDPEDCYATRNDPAEISSPTDPEDPYSTRTGVPERKPAIGPRFRILRPHAKGGLGQVSVAIDQEFGRQVALKEIQDHHADHPEHRSRFVREAEITGKLEHPGIIPVYGLGHYEDGRPYYAMRFIRGDTLGEAIARYHSAEGEKLAASERALQLRELLGRFLDVCNAIAYAHDRRVIHRDIKPGNILLGPFGETLIVDWGLAKPLDDSGDGESTLGPVRATLDGSDSNPTVAGVAHGTPAYMSPEQAEGRLDQLGPASDVYSLGATLYHVLVGSPPFHGPDVVRRVVIGNFPAPTRVNARVPRALEAICLKAMATRPGGRYPSPAELAVDIKRWLADEPVSAYRDPASARARRWMKRHRTAVTAGTATTLVALLSLAVLVAMTTASNRELRRANLLERQAKEREVIARRKADEDRRRAEVAEASARESARTELAAKETAQAATAEARIQANTASRTTRFLVDMLAAADPIGLNGLSLRGSTENVRTLTALEILDRGSRKIATDLKDEPLVQATLKATIGNVYRSQGLYDKAESLLREALAARRKLLKPDDPAIADSIQDLGWWHHDQARTSEALECYREALELRRKTLGERHPLVAQCLFHIAWLLTEEAEFDEAEALFRRSIAIRESIPGGERELAIARMGLSALLIDTHRFVEALPLILSAVRVQLTEQGMDDSVKALMLFQQGVAFRGMNLAKPAERALRGSLDIAVKALGNDHPYPAFVLFTLAQALDDQGRTQEAERYYRECLELVRRTIGMGYPRAIYLVIDYGRFLAAHGRRAEALGLYAELVEGRRKRYPAGHRMIADGLVYQGGFVFAADPARAEPFLREALAIYEQHPSKRSVPRLDCHEYLAEVLSTRKAYGEAEAMSRRSLELVSSLPPSAFIDRADTKAWNLSRLGCSLVQLDRWPEAEASLVEALRIYRSEVKAANRLNGFLALDGLSMLRRRQGRPSEAAALTEERRRHSRGNPNRLYNVALDLARCVTSTLRAGPPTPDQARACQAYGDQALEVLAEASRAGFKGFSRIKNDRDFDSLRGRPDFQAFVDDLPFPDRPIAR